MSLNKEILDRPESVEDTASKAVSLDWESEDLAKFFGKEVTGEVVAELSAHDEFNRTAFAATAGWHGYGAAHTTKAVNEEKAREAKLATQRFGHRAMATIITDNVTDPIINFISDHKIKLDNQAITINEDGVLQIEHNGQIHDATLVQKLKLEHNSQACSIGITSDEQLMNDYLNGKTDVIPDALHKLAEKHGRLADEVTRDEFRDIINTEYGAHPHIADRIVSPAPLQPLSLSDDLTPSTQSQASQLINRFSGDLTPDALTPPQQSLIPAPTFSLMPS